MGLHRSAIRRRRRSDAIATRTRNHGVKVKERTRRDVRMVESLKTGTLPYSPPVMSWLSRKLNKKTTKITPEDVKTVLS